MIEAIVLSRFLVDYFWEFKAISVAHTLFIAAVFLYLATKRLSSHPTATKTDLLIAFFTLYVVISYITSSSDQASLDALKIISCSVYYYIGRYYLGSINTKPISLVAAITIALLAIAPLVGVGFQDWGGVTTYSAGYFFKTDLALASLIFITFASLYSKKITLNIAIWLMGGYVILLSNARIAIPIFLLLAMLYYLLRTKRLYLNTKVAIRAALALIATLSFFYLVDLERFGLLSFDLNNPFSEKSTQGRNLIWATLIDFYHTLPLEQKLFGAGLASDITAADLLSNTADFEGKRAHNSYLWLLVCLGWAGSLTFLTILLAFIKQTANLAKTNPGSNTVYISTSLICIFIIISFTTEVIVRPQLTFPLFLFCGLCMNPNIRNLEKTKSSKK